MAYQLIQWEKGHAAQKKLWFLTVQQWLPREVKLAECIVIRSRLFNSLKNKQGNICNSYLLSTHYVLGIEDIIKAQEIQQWLIETEIPALWSLGANEC